ncbi:MAG: AAA family ATPase, partial [Proteobacteria bacterium]
MRIFMPDDLFDQKSGTQAPLAHRFRPKDLTEFLGQEKWLAPGRPLRAWIELDKVPSLLLYGPPGSGKTSLAKIIAEKTRSRFVSLSAVQSGLKEVREQIEQARNDYRFYQRKTVLFLDEIHRFNQSQQDALLPFVEDGTITLLGATTENPAYSMNRALLSRMRVIAFDRLSEESMELLLTRLKNSSEYPAARLAKLPDNGLERIRHLAQGDARRALHLFEEWMKLIESTQLPSEQWGEIIDAIESGPALFHDRASDAHYGLISAYIKSMRASDADGALYYLARMLEGGEDPLFIVRRLIIFASEDVGLADPRALGQAVAAKDALEIIGLPEGRIPLAQAGVDE